MKGGGRAEGQRGRGEERGQKGQLPPGWTGVKTESPFPSTHAHAGSPAGESPAVPAASPIGQARDRPGLSFPTCEAGSRQARQSERQLRSKNHRGPRPPQVNFPAAPRGWGSRPRVSSPTPSAAAGQACPHRPQSPPRRAAPTQHWPRPPPPTVPKSAPAQTPAPCRPPGRRREGRGLVSYARGGAAGDHAPPLLPTA